VGASGLCTRKKEEGRDPDEQKEPEDRGDERGRIVGGGRGARRRDGEAHFLTRIGCMLGQ